MKICQCGIIGILDNVVYLVYQIKNYIQSFLEVINPTYAIYII